ncbi:stalk domain-containing protein [Paenibacillus radicis (ex Xue et al. 2023)]|uniref:Stalk domain-containing protein n=1 Tax=Paenibacillus radicis (ex Xue et al. 2023) TaxID=2972489 RepID=A0ABT1YMV5_9BACL|nr:stalk domain-containing protein [Paenibacillus radicis (ex Xue et al. 2023)]MCR8633734.1 stalk domain-containing protein [Paenibacillus radicis (ex Xue et al. 2023)]
MNRARRLSHYLLLFPLTLLIWCASLALPAQQADAFSYSYEGVPKQTVGVTKPTLSFYFKSDTNTQPSSYSMYLNGQSVAVSYDAVNSIFTHTPSKDLAPGPYTVRIAIKFAGYETLEKSWTFNVAKDAIKQFAAATPDQLSTLTIINDYRVLHGLPAFNFNEQLSASATAHSNYLDINKVKQSQASQESLHTQDSDKTAFIGITPLERAAYFGFTKAVGEDAAYITGTNDEAIDALFDAPYHRNPFLNPYIKEVGIGKTGNYTIIEFGLEPDAGPQLVVSPAEGDRYVPTTFEGNESPDPLSIHPNEAFPVGYPIMAQYYGSSVKNVKLISSELLDSKKQPVETLVNTPDNDKNLDNAVIIMPRKPLLADSRYYVKLKLQVTKKDGSTVTEDKEWDFSTEPAYQVGKKKLHQNAANYKKYFVSVAPMMRTASFGLDSSSYQVDGISFPMKRTPVITEGFSYLYIRDLAAALGASVDWDEAQRAAVYTKGSLKVTLYTTKDSYMVNGEVRSTTTPARLIGENTMVPVRLLAEVLGAKVDYIEPTRTVNITY